MRHRQNQGKTERSDIQYLQSHFQFSDYSFKLSLVQAVEPLLIPVCADYWRSPSTRGSTWTASSCRWPAAVTSPQTSIHIMARKAPLPPPPQCITLKGQYRETRIFFHLSNQSSRVVTYDEIFVLFLTNMCLVWRSRRVREELSTFADTFEENCFN